LIAIVVFRHLAAWREGLLAFVRGSKPFRSYDVTKFIQLQTRNMNS